MSIKCLCDRQLRPILNFSGQHFIDFDSSQKGRVCQGEALILKAMFEDRSRSKEGGRMKLLFYMLLIAVALFGSGECLASRVLFIGNSFTGISSSALMEFADVNHDDFNFEFVGGINLMSVSYTHLTLPTKA